MILEVSSFVLLLAIIWVCALWYVNDFKVRPVQMRKMRILAVFPHPDDEVLTCSGLLSNSTSRLLILTKGEKGTPDGRLDSGMKAIRAAEAVKSASIIGAELEHHDFGDGEVKKHKAEIAGIVDRAICSFRPDLIITYDKSGLYGHEDHIAVSELVTEIARKKKICLWYAVINDKMLKLAKLPEHMAKSDSFKRNRKSPNIRYFTGLSLVRKIRALYAHESQRSSFRSAYPKLVPIWLAASLFVYEYYYSSQSY